MTDPFEPAEMFRRMAARLEGINSAEFGGVVLVVPPADQDGAFKPIELMLVDPARDAANFWVVTKNKVDATYSQFEELSRAREQHGYGGRR